jgi:hypothetical protein
MCSWRVPVPHHTWPGVVPVQLLRRALVSPTAPAAAVTAAAIDQLRIPHNTAQPKTSCKCFWLGVPYAATTAFAHQLLRQLSLTL